MKEIYDLDKLVKIRIRDKIINTLYDKVGPRKRNFWTGVSEIKEESYQQGTFGGIYTRKQLEKIYIVENGEVYDKPYVELYFGGDIKYKKEFDTYKEAKLWAKLKAEPYINKPFVGE